MGAIRRDGMGEVEFSSLVDDLDEAGYGEGHCALSRVRPFSLEMGLASFPVRGSIQI